MLNQSEKNNVVGVALVVFGVLFLSAMDALIKNLIENGFSVAQIISVRSWVVVPMLLVWMVFSAGGIGQIKTKQKGLHFLRVLFGFGAPFFFFQSLTTLHLADATVIFFGATFIMTGLSVPILKEKVGVHRWSAIAVGFVGILIANNPGGEVFNIGSIYAFSSSVCYSLMMIISRKLGSSEGTFKLLFFFHVWIGFVASLGLWLGVGGVQFVPMEMEFSMLGAGVVLAISALVIGGHYCLMRAFTIAPIGLLASFEYSGILWATLFGFIGWGYKPEFNFWVGASLVIASGIYVVMREIKVKKMGDASATMIDASGPVVAPIPPSVSYDK
ncbi:MAG: DMT family transporter [Rhodospirillaceae bacterium]|nr:DMT family transporter [Rhodospirillaceae bacterium]